MERLSEEGEALEMNIAIIHGQSHQHSTWHIARELSDRLQGDVTEFFLPRDFSQFCVGCTKCFMQSETLCPHYEALRPLVEALDRADVIILASPVYVYHMTGPMKAFLDHLGYRWMVHRPEQSMFHKQGVCISTAAGGGTGSTNRDMADSLFFWGVARIYRFGMPVFSTTYDGISEKRKQKASKKMAKLAEKIKRHAADVQPGLKTKLFFGIMRMMQRKGWNEADVAYWKQKGWNENARPWKNKS